MPAARHPTPASGSTTQRLKEKTRRAHIGSGDVRVVLPKFAANVGGRYLAFGSGIGVVEAQTTGTAELLIRRQHLPFDLTPPPRRR